MSQDYIPPLALYLVYVPRDKQQQLTQFCHENNFECRYWINDNNFFLVYIPKDKQDLFILFTKTLGNEIRYKLYAETYGSELDTESKQLPEDFDSPEHPNEQRFR